MRFKPVKSKADKSEAVHGMVQSGMPMHLARSVVKRMPMMPKKKKKGKGHEFDEYYD